jgi:YVTN family beta-propeller protein
MVATAAVLGTATGASATTSYSVLATVDTGSPLGDGLAIDESHHSVYVVNTGANQVSVIDTTTNTVKKTIAVGVAPFRVAVDPGLDRAYVTNSGSSSMSVIDTNSNTVVSTITDSRFNTPRGVAVDPTTHLVYVTIYYDNQMLAVIDPTKSPATIDYTDILESRPWAVDVDPTTHRAYPTTLFGGTLSTVSGTTILGATYGFNGPTQVTVDPVTKQAYVARKDGMSVVDISGNTPVITGTLVAGTQPSDLAIDQGTSIFYVSNYGDDTVSVIDGDTSSILATVPVGGRPSAVEVDPVTHRAYVVNSGDNTVTVISSVSTQEITFTSSPPAQPVAGGTYTATATGGSSGNPVTFSTTSPACTVTSSGQVAFTHVGECLISADQGGDVSHTAAPTVDQTMTVGVGPQAITFTSVSPSPTSVGGSYTVDAVGGGSTEPVTLSVATGTTNAACSIAGDVVSFDHVGTCVIAADQAGDADYTAAPQVTQQMTVDLEATTAAVTLPTDHVVHGQAATAGVAVGSTHGGSVQFTVDGAAVGNPIALDQGGTATSGDLTPGLSVGSHQVGAVFAPTDTNRYAGSTATPQTLTIDRAATTSTVSVGATSVTSAVTVTAPGAGVPTGTVRFYVAGTEVGSAALTAGTATLSYQVPTGSTREVTAVYDGDADFTGSSASTARRDPVITAHVASAHAPRNGWFSAPVTVTFACAETSAPLTQACPDPVTLSTDAAGQSVTRTVIATDGGAATVVVNGINIDTVRPAVRVTGVRAGATYLAAGPRAASRATDNLSGIATCTVTRTTHRHRVVYVANATDHAGNTSSTRLVARTTRVSISGASMRHGHYVVHRGRTYTVLVAATKRPRYVYAAPSPRRPAGGYIAFNRIGKHTWALGVTFKQSMRHHTMWKIGTRVGSHMTITTVRVVR